MRVLIFLVLSLSVTGSLAQDNYGFEEAFIMTKQGDSIKGFIEVAPNYGPKIRYKKSHQRTEKTEKQETVEFLSHSSFDQPSSSWRRFRTVAAGGDTPSIPARR